MDFFEELNEYKTKIEGRKHLEAKLSELEYIKNQLYIKLPLLSILIITNIKQFYIFMVGVVL